ncbi:MAG: TIGR00268 family protein, partial [Candidatus Hecatellales archaeon]
MADFESLVEKLVEDLRRKGGVVVALSGGVDSSVVAALAHKA